MKKINIKGVAMKTAGTTAGAVAGAMLNKVSFIGQQKPIIRAGIKLAVAALVPGLAKSKSGDIVDHAATGLMAMAGLELANSFINDPAKKFSIAGIGDLPALGAYNAGYGADITFDEDYRTGGSEPMM